MSWSVVFLDETVQAELDALPSDFRASFERISNLIQTLGIERVREPYIRHLADRLWEMQLAPRWCANRPEVVLLLPRVVAGR